MDEKKKFWDCFESSFEFGNILCDVAVIVECYVWWAPFYSWAYLGIMIVAELRCSKLEVLYYSDHKETISQWNIYHYEVFWCKIPSKYGDSVYSISELVSGSFGPLVIPCLNCFYTALRCFKLLWSRQKCAKLKQPSSDICNSGYKVYMTYKVCLTH